MALVNLWREDRDGVRRKGLRQILAFAGEGRLLDGGACSVEFRDLLRLVPLDTLGRYSEEALNDGGEEPGLALQDVVNELGVRVGFEVTPGRYRGKRGEPGHDGLWHDRDSGHTIIVEVKTTTSYRIKLDSIFSYRALLEEQSKIKKSASSVLIVLGRSEEDTEDLEAQIRGSRHAWSVRILSLGALRHMAELREAADDPESARLLRRILVPQEFTKLDPLLEFVTRVARDVSTDDSFGGPPPEAIDESKGKCVSKLDREGLRAVAKSFIEERIKQSVSDISRTLIESVDGKTGICYAPSRPYRKASHTLFWFGLHEHQVTFMRSHESAFVAYLCVGEGVLFMPWAEVSRYVDEMGETASASRLWKHVVLQLTKQAEVRLRLRGDSPNNPVDVTRWFTALKPKTK